MSICSCAAGAGTRWRSWWSIIRVLPQAGRAVPVAALLNLVIGLLPLGFVIATSVAISRVPALGQSAHGAWGPVLAAMTLAIAALLLQSALSPFQAAFTELISRRVDGFCTRRLMRATLAEAPVAQLEQAAVLDKLSDARRGLVEYFVTPGAAAAGLVTLVARYAQLLGAVVIVGDRPRPARRAPDRRRGPGRPGRQPGVAVPLVGDHRPAVGGAAQDVLRLRHRQRAGRRQGDPRARHAGLVARARRAGVRRLPAAAVARPAPYLPRPVRLVQPCRARRGRRGARPAAERGGQRRAQRARPVPRDPGDPHPAAVRRVLPRGRRADAVRHARP